MNITHSERTKLEFLLSIYETGVMKEKAIDDRRSHAGYQR